MFGLERNGLQTKMGVGLVAPDFWRTPPEMSSTKPQAAQATHGKGPPATWMDHSTASQKAF